jgi:hypothetical protein
VSVNEMNICSLINTNPNPKRAAVVGEWGRVKGNSPHSF